MLTVLVLVGAGIALGGMATLLVVAIFGADSKLRKARKLNNDNNNKEIS